MKYYDKNGVEIKAGMMLIMSDRTTELVYATTNQDGKNDLGINASNEDYLCNHENCCRVYYSLGRIDLQNVEVWNERT